MAAEALRELLSAVLRRTLEEAAFVFAEPGGEAAARGEPLVEARLAYSAAHEGELALAAPLSLAETFARNLLGEEEGSPVAPSTSEDAVGELLNMVAGALAVELFGDARPCRLGLPRVRRLTADRHRLGLASAAAAVTLVEEGGRAIHLALERRAGP